MVQEPGQDPPDPYTCNWAPDKQPRMVHAKYDKMSWHVGFQWQIKMTKQARGMYRLAATKSNIEAAKKWAARFKEGTNMSRNDDDK